MCGLPSLYVHRIYGNPSLWPSCFWLQIFISLGFSSVFRMTTRKLRQPRPQVVFLTWSFLSRIVINIYILLYFSVIKMLLCTVCVQIFFLMDGYCTNSNPSKSRILWWSMNRNWKSLSKEKLWLSINGNHSRMLTWHFMQLKTIWNLLLVHFTVLLTCSSHCCMTRVACF